MLLMIPNEPFENNNYCVALVMEQQVGFGTQYLVVTASNSFPHKLHYPSGSLVQSIPAHMYSSQEQYTPCSHHNLQCILLYTSIHNN